MGLRGLVTPKEEMAEWDGDKVEWNGMDWSGVEWLGDTNNQEKKLINIMDWIGLAW